MDGFRWLAGAALAADGLLAGAVDGDPGTGRRLDRFERWQTVRVVGQVATLAAALAAAVPGSRR